MDEAVLTGSRGFQTPQAITSDGKAVLDWVVPRSSRAEGVWARLDFDSGKRLVEVRVRVTKTVPPHLRNQNSYCLTKLRFNIS